MKPPIHELPCHPCLTCFGIGWLYLFTFWARACIRYEGEGLLDKDDKPYRYNEGGFSKN